MTTQAACYPCSPNTGEKIQTKISKQRRAAMSVSMIVASSFFRTILLFFSAISYLEVFVLRLYSATRRNKPRVQSRLNSKEDALTHFSLEK